MNQQPGWTGRLIEEKQYGRSTLFGIVAWLRNTPYFVRPEDQTLDPGARRRILILVYLRNGRAASSGAESLIKV
jgi:hypothetical protein